MSEMSIRDYQAAMETGALTARQISENFLARIDQIDQQGPALNAVLEINPDALAIADALDQERQEKGPRSPLHGIPILVKDNIDTADQMETTSGSLALAGSRAAKDAFLVTRLREAGAIILGKANLSEWANFRSPHSSSGWSSRGGQTRNPYALDRNPCGSSSGSAVAVAADLCAAAVGTETDGSVICPSQTNGIVGLKPTLGLVSRSGIIPIAHSQDTAGSMGRTVTDVAILLGGLVGVDPEDEATEASRAAAVSDYTQYLDADGLKGARIGVARNYFGFHNEVDHIMEWCLEEMARLGADLIDPANVDNSVPFGASEIEVLLYEFKADLNAYLASLPPEMRVHSLADVIQFNEQNKEKTMPFFGQERMLLAAEKGPLSEEAYRDALTLNHRLAREEGIDATVNAYKLDAIVAPSGSPAWLTDWVNGDNVGGSSSSAPAVAGYPNITVPAGTIFGLPVGISFFSTAFQEPTLLKLAYAFEQATQVRQPPAFLPSVIFE